METFVIRVWTPAEPDHRPPAGVPRGFVHHVGSGRERDFRELEELLAVIRELLRIDEDEAT